MYRTITKIAKRFFTDAQIYKYGFNWSPMYRRSTGRLLKVSEDLMYVKIKIPLSIKNRNFVGTIFGGSLFSATDPIYMIQLMNILGDDYVVWDKSATIKFKRPAKEIVFAEFIFSEEDLNLIKTEVSKNGEFNLVKTPNIVDKNGTIIAELSKTIYVADKVFYKNKLKRKTNSPA
jgi:acyl-coenzyme A thioesterase PaaI-like protein